MPPIQSAEEAVNVAENLLGKYYPYRRLKTVVREDDTWLLEFDVGAFLPKIVSIRVDVGSGSISKFETAQ